VIFFRDLEEEDQPERRLLKEAEDLTPLGIGPNG
jgi:hypothetical protein